MAEMKLRWGILSTARIGIRELIPAIRQSSNGIVAAIASRDERTAQEAAKAGGIPRAFGSYEAMLESRDIDAIYNPLPNNMHKEWTIHAVGHGKHVLCEKPFALNATEADEMIAAARQHRMLLMEALPYHFHPQYARVRSLIADGAIGQLKTIRMAFCFWLERDPDIRWNKDMGGGSLMDVGCYCVDMSRLIARAEPMEAQATAIWHKKYRVDETLAGLLRFPNDVIALFDCSFRTDYRESLDIQGTTGRILLPRPVKPLTQPAEIILYREETRDTLANQITVTAPAGNPYRLMVEHFADAVLNGKPLLFPPEEGRANMRVIDALFESACTGRAVQLEI